MNGYVGQASVVYFRGSPLLGRTVYCHQGENSCINLNMEVGVSTIGRGGYLLFGAFSGKHIFKLSVSVGQVWLLGPLHGLHVGFSGVGT